jgi:hypothetical protein
MSFNYTSYMPCGCANFTAIIYTNFKLFKNTNLELFKYTTFMLFNSANLVPDRSKALELLLMRSRLSLPDPLLKVTSLPRIFLGVS